MIHTELRVNLNLYPHFAELYLLYENVPNLIPTDFYPASYLKYYSTALTPIIFREWALHDTQMINLFSFKVFPLHPLTTYRHASSIFVGLSPYILKN